MKNNKLTAKYIKDVFRFMEIYHINKTENNLVTFVIENNGYNIISNNNDCELKLHTRATVQELLDDFKKSKYYMIDLEDKKC